MEEENITYKATIINNPTGNNNPIFKFKLENGTYIEKEYNYGPTNWGKGQTFKVKYDNNEIEILEKYKLKNLYKLPFLLYPISIIFVIMYYIINKQILNFVFIIVLSLMPIILSCIIYYTREKKSREKSEQRTKGKIIAFSPIFKSHLYSDYNRTYYALEWRVLFEFKTYNGEIFRCIEDDKIFGGDRDALTCKFKLNNEIPIKYNTENPLTAVIDNDEYEIEFRSFKGDECKAKILQIKTVKIESLEKENLELGDCFEQDYLICEYKIGNETYREKSHFPVNCGMFSIGEEIPIRYNVNDHKEYNVSYTLWNQ